MTSVLMAFIIGLIFGAIYRDLRDKVDELYATRNQPPAKKPGVTLGSYKHIDEVNLPKPAAKARGRVVTPKTPQKMDWDAEQELKEANEKFRVGPK